MTSLISDRVTTPSSGSDKSHPSDTQKGSLGGTGLETRGQEEQLVLEIWWKTSSRVQVFDDHCSSGYQLLVELLRRSNEKRYLGVGVLA